MSKFGFKHRGVSVLLGLMVFMFSQTAYGFEIVYEGGENPVTVSGASEVKKAGQVVTLRIDNEAGTSVFAWQAETDADGIYRFEFNPDYFGESTVAISADNTMLNRTFYRSTNTEVENAVSRLNGNETAETVIGEEAKVLMVDYDEFVLLNKDGKFADFLEKQSYSIMKDFIKSYDTGKFLAKIRNNKTGDAAKALEAESECVYVEEMSVGELDKIYSESSAAEKGEVLKNITGKDFESLEAYIKSRNEYTAFNIISKANNYNEKYATAKKYNVFGLDFDKFEALDSDLEEFKEEWFSMSASTVEEFIANAQSAYEEVSGYEGGVGSGSGGGSGGSSGGGGKYKDLNISGTYTPDVPKVSDISFSDLDSCEWARTAITLLAAKGVINGKSAGVFAPMDSVTRAEFVKLLVGAFNISGTTDKAFEDVPKEHWAHSYISAAVANGIVNGISETSFGSGNKITRQDMAVLCARFLESKGIALSAEEVSFNDNNTISDYAKDSIYKLAGAGIINGVGDNLYAPYNTATRAEAAVIIYRLYDYVTKG